MKRSTGAWAGKVVSVAMVHMCSSLQSEKYCSLFYIETLRADAHKTWFSGAENAISMETDICNMTELHRSCIKGGHSRQCMKLNGKLREDNHFKSDKNKLQTKMENTSLFSLSMIALSHVSIDHNPERIFLGLFF